MKRLVAQTFEWSFLSIELQCHVIIFRMAAGFRSAQSPGTVEAFTVCMLVTGGIDRLPEPVPPFAGTSCQEDCYQHPWQQKQSLRTKGGEWIAGFHQWRRFGLFLSVIRARSVFAQMMLFQDVAGDGSDGGIQGG